MNVKARYKITEITIHWSESIYLSKLIDPTWQKLYNAGFKTSLAKFKRSAKAVAQELASEGRSTVDTNITVRFENEKEFTLVIQIHATTDFSTNAWLPELGSVYRWADCDANIMTD